MRKSIDDEVLLGLDRSVGNRQDVGRPITAWANASELVRRARVAAPLPASNPRIPARIVRAPRLCRRALSVRSDGARDKQPDARYCQFVLHESASSLMHSARRK
jgi:hypothetical protein